MAGDAEIVFEASKQNFFQVLNQLKLRGEKCCYLTGLPKALFCCGLALGKRSQLRKSERRKATKKNIKNQCLFSSSLLQKSERRKE